MITALKKINGTMRFFIIVILLYGIFGVINPELIHQSLRTAGSLFMQIIPVLLLVFFIMFITNMVIDAKKITTEMQHHKGISACCLAVVFGILSAGPIYLWYPLLSDLKERGLRTSLITIFLYNRAIKLPLLPVMIYYFGWHFVLIVSILMILFSVINGFIVERLLLTPSS
ncbi:hypothetical protein GF369_02945 [Candidatus Peregrinibacteria bacterium]|nr:hypothetical protein [Candidatus Peregrinibacteria bacterium]